MIAGGISQLPARDCNSARSIASFLVLEASAPPPPAVIDLLSRHKAEVVATPSG
jgi:hypothetical protein